MRWAAGLAAVALLAGAFALGRWSAPVREEKKEKVSTKAVEAEAKHAEMTKDGALALATGRTEKVRIRYLRRPDGSVQRDVYRSNEASSRVEAAQKETKREAEIRYVDREKTVEKITVIEGQRAQWGIEARIGCTLDARPAYSGAVTRRILGPLWAGVWADSTKAAGIQARLEW